MIDKEANRLDEAVFIDPSESLPKIDLIKEILVIAFTDEKILMVTKENQGPRFPEILFEQHEALEKTVRREIYNQTGALIKNSRLLGTLTFKSEIQQENTYIPIYIGQITAIENTVLMPKTIRRKLLDIEDCYTELKDEYWTKIKDYLFYHAFKLFQALKHNGGEYYD